MAACHDLMLTSVLGLADAPFLVAPQVGDAQVLTINGAKCTMSLSGLQIVSSVRIKRLKAAG